MKGYIAITSREWINNIQREDYISAVFWCKKKNFKALSLSEKFYFLERGGFKSNADRYLVGYGCFKSFERLKPNDAWNKYGSLLGAESKNAFKEFLQRCIEKDFDLFWDEKIQLMDI